MILTKASFDIIRQAYGPLSQSQVDSLNFLVSKMEAAGFTYPEAAYALATVKIETDHTFLPIREKGSQAYLRSKKYWPYIGYGYVQLTWEENYKRVGKLIGVDLVKNPALALEPEIAAKIMTGGMLAGWFTGLGFRRYRPVSRYNLAQYKAARNIINGSDRATEIANIAMVMEKALRS